MESACPILLCVICERDNMLTRARRRPCHRERVRHLAELPTRPNRGFVAWTREKLQDPNPRQARDPRLLKCMPILELVEIDSSKPNISVVSHKTSGCTVGGEMLDWRRALRKTNRASTNCEDDYHLHLWSFKTHYDYYSFPIITIVSICNCAVWVQVSRGSSIGSHGLLLSVNGSSLIPSVSVFFSGHIPAHNAWDEASDKSDNCVDIIVDSYKDSSNEHCRRSSLECASSIGVYTSTHRAGRWTEGEDLLLTLVHLPAEP